jgi:light-regulated signal transduction histidine kinase (bacteriophytochrome)
LLICVSPSEGITLRRFWPQVAGAHAPFSALRRTLAGVAKRVESAGDVARVFLRIAQGHHGQVVFDSVSGQGSTFWYTFPLTRFAEEAA